MLSVMVLAGRMRCPALWFLNNFEQWSDSRTKPLNDFQTLDIAEEAINFVEQLEQRKPRKDDLNEKV